MLYMLLFVLVVVCVCSANVGLDCGSRDPERDMTATQIIRYWGYPAEDHWVTTADGYILGIHRIPAGRSRRFQKGPKPVVFLQHGLLDCSASWVINKPEQSFGFMLADAGYDVWLGNIRGNTYSKNHTSLSPNDKKFWDFSFDEFAYYDLPKMLNYVIEQTGVKSLSYFGHSQGTEIAWIELSRNQALASKVNFFGAFAPVARITHAEGFFKYLNMIAPEFQFLLRLLGVNEFIPSNWLMKTLAKVVCPVDKALVCREVMFLVCGWDQSNLNTTRVPVYVAHTPAGTSTKNVIHWSQMIRAGKMQMYDYGKKGNMQHYQSPTPPGYDISEMNIPIALVSGGNDFLGDTRDVAWLEGQLKPGLIKANIFYDNYNHMDFVWGLDANINVYDKMIALLNVYNN